MTRKAKFFFWLGAGFTGLAVAMFTRPFLGPDVAPMLGAMAGWAYFNFAALPVQNATLSTASFCIGLLGINYLIRLRNSALDIGLGLVAIALSAAIALVGKRKLAESPPSHRN